MFFFKSNFDSSCNLKCKNHKKLTMTKTDRSRYAFSNKNQKLGNLRMFSLTSNFDSCCNLRRKNEKKLTKTKGGQDMLLEEKLNISEVSILSYTQN